VTSGLLTEIHQRYDKTAAVNLQDYMKISTAVLQVLFWGGVFYLQQFTHFLKQNLFQESFILPHSVGANITLMLKALSRSWLQKRQ